MFLFVPLPCLFLHSRSKVDPQVLEIIEKASIHSVWEGSSLGNLDLQLALAMDRMFNFSHVSRWYRLTSCSQDITISYSEYSFASGWSPGETLGNSKKTIILFIGLALVYGRNPAVIKFQFPRVYPGDWPKTLSRSWRLA